MEKSVFLVTLDSFSAPALGINDEAEKEQQIEVSNDITDNDETEQKNNFDSKIYSLSQNDTEEEQVNSDNTTVPGNGINLSTQIDTKEEQVNSNNYMLTGSDINPSAKSMIDQSESNDKLPVFDPNRMFSALNESREDFDDFAIMHADVVISSDSDEDIIILANEKDDSQPGNSSGFISVRKDIGNANIASNENIATKDDKISNIVLDDKISRSLQMTDVQDPTIHPALGLSTETQIQINFDDSTTTDCQEGPSSKILQDLNTNPQSHANLDGHFLSQFYSDIPNSTKEKPNVVENQLQKLSENGNISVIPPDNQEFEIAPPKVKPRSLADQISVVCPTCKNTLTSKCRVREHMARHVLKILGDYVDNENRCLICYTYTSTNKQMTKRHVALAHNFVFQCATPEEQEFLKSLNLHLNKTDRYVAKSNTNVMTSSAESNGNFMSNPTSISNSTLSRIELPLPGSLTSTVTLAPGYQLDLPKQVDNTQELKYGS